MQYTTRRRHEFHPLVPSRTKPEEIVQIPYTVNMEVHVLSQSSGLLTEKRFYPILIMQTNYAHARSLHIRRE